MQAQVHEQGGGVLQAVGGGSLNFVEMPYQPLDYSAGNQLFSDIAPSYKKYTTSLGSFIII